MAKILGFNVWSHIHGVLVPTDKVVAAFAAAGLNLDLLDEPTASRAFSRAMQDQNSKRRGTLARPITRRGCKVVYGIVNEDVDVEEEELDYSQTTRVEFDKQSETLAVEGDLAEEVLASFDRYQGVITSHEIRAFIVNLVHELRGVAKRPTGGIYFVPFEGQDDLVAARKVIYTLGFGKLYVERIFDGKAERAALWDGVEREVAARLKEVRDRVDRLGSRVSSAEAQEERVKDLRNLTSTYQEMLGEAARYADLAETFDKTASQVAAKVRKLRVAKEGA